MGFRQTIGNRVAFRLLLLAAYSFFFSVQVCFRYTSGGTDTDAAVQSYTLGAQHHAGHPGAVLSGHAQHQSEHLLNKRFQPGDDISFIPAREFALVTPFAVISNTYYTTTDPTFSQNRITLSLRGPPSPIDC